MPDTLTLSQHHDEEEVTVQACGEVDLVNVSRLLSAGRCALQTSSAQALVLDLRQVSFMDSAGIGACVNLLKSARDLQRAARVDLQAPAVVRAFSVMGLMTAFDVRVSTG